MADSFYDQVKAFSAGVVALCAILGVGLLYLIYKRTRRAEHHYQEQLKEISQILAKQPTEEPTGANFYAVRSFDPFKSAHAPASNRFSTATAAGGGAGADDLDRKIRMTQEEKLETMKALRRQNIPVLDTAFNGISKHVRGLKRAKKYEITVAATPTSPPVWTVKDGVIFVQHNQKTDESLLAKASRPEILKQYPKYGIEHIRDALRFKGVVMNLIDGFRLLQYLIQRPNWSVVKLDL